MKPCTIIIFGATGDLSKKKLLPALYHLNIENRLTDDTKIICMGRREVAQDDWKSQVSGYVSDKARGGVKADALENFLAKISYFKNDINDAASYQDLKTLLDDPAN
ncbi:MAG: glucose-6-phosphate dehydrogenase, partial [Proteobacteria bacterium]|nr:glucose-6-phosphate dehydrogenase [Pseudomonadota bacterium]